MWHELMTRFAEAIQFTVIFIGFVAMWSLWVARRERSEQWTSKMKDIWICHILFVAAAVEANIERLYRDEAPTAGTVLIAFVMVWTIKGAFNGKMYTKDQFLED
jgi:hypothetical protein